LLYLFDDFVLDLDRRELRRDNTSIAVEPQVFDLLEYLIGKGRELKVYDPHIQLDQIYGSNRDYILNAIPHIGKLLTGGFEEVAGWVHHGRPGIRLWLQLSAQPGQTRARGKNAGQSAHGPRRECARDCRG